MNTFIESEVTDSGKKYLNPTFKDWTETPFEEITLADTSLYAPNIQFATQPEFQGNYESYLDQILVSIRSVLLTLDPNQKYFFSHSSGSDSRIISGVMSQLRDEGLANFSNVLFYCWGRPEENSFRQIMKKGGWENFIVHNDTKPNAFDVGVPDFCVDGWNPFPSQMKFWGDIDPSEYIFLSGEGGSTFERPYAQWIHSRGFFLERGEATHRICRIFKGGFFPLLSYDVLELTMAMPKTWRNVKDTRIGRDKVRTDLVERVGLLDIPVDRAYYNFNFTEDRKRQMMELYQLSAFRRDVGVELDFNDIFKNANGWSSRCWSFAVTVYDQLMCAKPSTKPAPELSIKTSNIPMIGASSTMTDQEKNAENENLLSELKALECRLMQVGKQNTNNTTKDLLIVQNRLFAQLESLSWLQRRLNIKGQLPPLRGWATSPDVLVRLHAHIIDTKPKVIVEFGSGASTLVIADALKQNGKGKLFSIEHSDHYGAQTLATLKAEKLEKWVVLRINELEPWVAAHLNPADAKKPSYWYAQRALIDIKNIDLLWVDGPPGATCLFSRYPALPALADKLSPNAEVWMDDTIRQEEKDICQRWAEDYGFELEYFPLEKGLGRLTKPKTQLDTTSPKNELAVIETVDPFSEKSVGLDFSLPEER